jgi:hypothetical protein
MNKSQKPNLTDLERRQIYQILSGCSFNGKLPKGIVSHLGSEFNVTPRTISRIWKQGQISITSGLPYADVESKIKFKSGRKKFCSSLVLKSQRSQFLKDILIN